MYLFDVRIEQMSFRNFEVSKFFLKSKRKNDLGQYNINADDQIVDKDAESWWEYNESNNCKS